MKNCFLRATRAFFGLLSFVAGANCVLAAAYSVTDLGVLTDTSGRTDAKPNAINSSGAVAAANVSNGAYQALLYSGAWTDLGTLGGNESLGAGINDSGQVVGSSTTGTGSNHGFLWTAGGKDGVSGNPEMKDLDTLGGNTSEAAAINRLGQITGYSDVPSHPTVQQHAFIYSSGAMSDVGKLLSGLPNSFGYGINASGHIAGTAYDSAYSQPHAFFYNGTMAVDIGSLSGLGATALGLNDGDHLVGYFTTSSGGTHAFSYANGAMADLGTLGGNYSYGIGINNQNVIVGGTFIDAKDSIYHAFIWNGSSMVDLNTLLDASGAGWTLAEARAINDAGQIVGTGTYAGSEHAFLLTPKTTGLSAPVITSMKVNGSQVVISFTTVGTANYSVETCDSLPGSAWSDLATGIAGTGGSVSVTNLNTGSISQRFYRVKATSK